MCSIEAWSSVLISVSLDHTTSHRCRLTQMVFRSFSLISQQRTSACDECDTLNAAYMWRWCLLVTMIAMLHVMLSWRQMFDISAFVVPSTNTRKGGETERYSTQRQMPNATLKNTNSIGAANARHKSLEKASKRTRSWNNFSWCICN